MPKRMNVKKFDTSEVMGEDSYIKLRMLTVGEIRHLRKESAKAKRQIEQRQAQLEAGKEPTVEVPEFDWFEKGLQLLAKQLVSWNWVDEEGEPLPHPREDPTVIDRLTEEESEVIVDCLMGEKEAKN